MYFVPIIPVKRLNPIGFFLLVEMEGGFLCDQQKMATLETVGHTGLLKFSQYSNSVTHPGILYFLFLLFFESNCKERKKREENTCLDVSKMFWF